MTTPSARGIYIADVSSYAGFGEHRKTKHCVCVAVSGGMYLFINTSHRDMYDDFKISASDYKFLNGVDRFLSCRSARALDARHIIREVGTLSVKDTETVIAKISASDTIPDGDREFILAELRRAQNRN